MSIVDDVLTHHCGGLAPIRRRATWQHPQHSLGHVCTEARLNPPPTFLTTRGGGLALHRFDTRTYDHVSTPHQDPQVAAHVV